MSSSLVSRDVVIVGAGQAGADLAAALRQNRYAGSVTLVGDEPHLPYRRPPLSKAGLTGELTGDSLLLRRSTFYEAQAIECRTGVAASAIDRARRELQLSDGARLAYGHLVLATGGRPRPLPWPHADRPNVHMIRTLDDAHRLRAELVQGRRLVVIGAGYIGLEAAASACKRGLRVQVVEAQPRVLARSVGPALSSFLEAAHRRRGIDLRIGVGIEALEGGDTVTCVRLQDGSALACDLVLVGIGLLPNTALAEAAGLEVDNGIVVDAHARTADPHILAIGDCANHFNGHFGRSMRLESVPSATEQARTAALTLCGQPTPHHSVPWFWSEQFDLKLQMVGLADGHTQCVVREVDDPDAFCAFYLREQRVIAVHAVNRPQDFMLAKRMVAEGWQVDAARLADAGTALKSLAPEAIGA